MYVDFKIICKNLMYGYKNSKDLLLLDYYIKDY